MNASKTPGTADHLNTITELLDALSSASELVGLSAQRLQDCNKHHTAGRLVRAQKTYEALIASTLYFYGEAISPLWHGTVPDTEAVRDAAPELLDALQAVSLTVAIHASQNPGDREAQQDMAKVRAALTKATTARPAAPWTSETADPAHDRPERSGHCTCDRKCGVVLRRDRVDFVCVNCNLPREISDPAHGGPGGTMGDAAAAMPVPGCTVGNELHSRPLTRGEASTQGGAA